ncbi:MAG TPA: HNH endonuclease, partial [Blastocatellia bacterium]|nr:HNH endonuclease [Blastocatellia bacterium]
MTRERWSADGQNRFSIDHIKPKSRHRKLICDYDNLVYACQRCNTWKSAKLGLPDPCKTNLSKHIKLLHSGYFVGLTPEGKRLVEYLRLNAAERVSDRRMQLYLFQTQEHHPKDILDSQFGY